MPHLISAIFEVVSFTAIIVLIVLGLGVIVSMMGIFNFAQGEFVLLGAYVTWLAAQLGLPVAVAMCLAPLAVGGFGLIVERLVVRRLYLAPIAAMLATYALGLAIRESVRGLTGGQFLAVQAPLAGNLALFGASMSAWRVAIVVVTVVTVAASWLLIAKTSAGLKVRAAMADRHLAKACGISTERVFAWTFAFGAALAGLAGALLVPIFSLHADLGLGFLIQGFISVMVGGAGSFAGPIVGGASIGLLSASLPWVVPPVLAEVLVFVAAIFFVRLVPGGLFTIFQNRRRHRA